MKKDSGNFVMLLLAAGVAGVWLGDGAFKAVLYIGMAAMVLGLLAHIANSWKGVHPGVGLAVVVGCGLLAAAYGDGTVRVVSIVALAMIAIAMLVYWALTYADQPAPTHRSASGTLRELLDAVEHRQSSKIERLVTQGDVSPFQRAAWRGALDVSANELAKRMAYRSAVRFFEAWSKEGRAARFIEEPIALDPPTPREALALPMRAPTDFAAPPPEGPTTPDEPLALEQRLIMAVERRDLSAVEDLVFDYGADPWRMVLWQGRYTSGYERAVAVGFRTAVSFMEANSSRAVNLLDKIPKQ